MRSKLVRLLLFAVVLACPPIVDGECVYDCYELNVMAGVQNGEPYCYSFAESTGRIVWSSQPIRLGGTPISTDCVDGGTSQEVVKWSSCPASCPINRIPQETTVGGVVIGVIGFGCYYCSG